MHFLNFKALIGKVTSASIHGVPCLIRTTTHKFHHDHDVLGMYPAMNAKTTEYFCTVGWMIWETEREPRNRREKRGGGGGRDGGRGGGEERSFCRGRKDFLGWFYLELESYTHLLLVVSRPSAADFPVTFTSFKMFCARNKNEKWSNSPVQNHFHGLCW